MKQWIIYIAAIVLYQTCLSGCSSQKVANNPIANTVKPNIIVFFTDDQGYEDLGVYGTQHFITPNIDYIANNGIKFNQFYAPAPVCTPSRAGLLSGKYPKRTGLHKEVIYPYSTHGLDPDITTIPDLLKPLGYTSACIGKWHLGNQLKYMPNNHGFDYFYGVPYSNDMDEYYYKDINYQSPPLPLYLNQNIVRTKINQDSLTSMWTTAAVDFIKSNHTKPFFLYLAHNMPHDPWHASKNFQGSSKYSLYGDAIQELDWSMGQILDVLKEEGILENTLILFTSDNGPLTRLKNGGSAGMLRGGKATTWEGGMRVPGIAYWPSKIPGGIVSNEATSTLDLMPTFVALAGGKVPENLVHDGRDISSLFLKPNQYIPQPFEMLYYSRNGNVEAYTDGVWKVHVAKELGWNEKTQGVFPISLYNLKTDPGEKKNVVAEHPEILNKLKERMLWLDNHMEASTRK
ncbi:MAG: sulfatase [Niabella sp.]